MWLANHLALLFVLPLLIRLMPLPVLLGLLTPSTSRRIPRLGKAPDPERIVAITDRILGRPGERWRRGCMKRSLALYRQLRLADVPVEWCLGVKWHSVSQADDPPSAPFFGHAWLAHGETVLYEKASHVLSQYAETYRYPEPPVDKNSGNRSIDNHRTEIRA